MSNQNNVYYTNKAVAGRGGLIVGSSRDAIYNAVDWKQWTPETLENNPGLDLIDSTKNMWFRFGDNVTLLFNVLLRKVGNGPQLDFVVPTTGTLYGNVPPFPDGLITTFYASGAAIRDEDAGTLIFGDVAFSTYIVNTAQKFPIIRILCPPGTNLSNETKYKINLKIEYKADDRLVQSENARGSKGNHFNY